MMQEEVRWIGMTADKYESSTVISVDITGWGAQSIREHYGREEGNVRVAHILTLREGEITWSANLHIGNEIVHHEPPEVTTAGHALSEGEKWKTRLTGGHRMIRHLIEVVR